MRRQVVEQTARRTQAAVCGRLPQFSDLAQQQVNLLLLAHDDVVELLQLILAKGGFDFQMGQALIGSFVVGHAVFDLKNLTLRI